MPKRHVGRSPTSCLLRSAPQCCLDISVSIGPSGQATPFAELEPVFVGGVTVGTATLHNEDQVAAKDVRPGDTVIVRRAGDGHPRSCWTGAIRTPTGLGALALSQGLSCLSSPVGARRGCSGHQLRQLRMPPTDPWAHRAFRGAVPQWTSSFLVRRTSTGSFQPV